MIVKTKTLFFSVLVLIIAGIFPSCEKEEISEALEKEELQIKMTSDAEWGLYLSTSAGKTIYMYSRDLEGISKCEGDCLDEWEPVGITASLPDRASNEFGLLRRDDGFVQLSFKGWPLYTYKQEPQNEISADNKNGEWYLAKPDYSLFIGLKTVDGEEKKFLIDENGQSVYYKSDDAVNQSSCTTASCILKYPPLKLKASIFPSILDASLVQNLSRNDSIPQSSYKNKPLYTHSLDGRGEASGQGFLGVWFVMEDSFF